MRKYKGYEFWTKKELIDILKKHDDDVWIYPKDSKIKITNTSPEFLDERGLI